VLLQLWAPEHVTSQAHESPQSTLAHEPLPLQVTWQGPDPQVTDSHEFGDEHCTLHEAAFEQSTSRHEPAAQLIVQFQPFGQTTLPLPLPSRAHVIASESHVVHSDGHSVLDVTQ